MALRTRLLIVGGVTLYVWALLVWDYFHGGVPVHHFLARGDMPAFPNWWGGLLLPLLAAFVTYRVQQRVATTNPETEIPTSVILTFLSALVYGGAIAFCFSQGVEDVPFYMLVTLIAFSLFFPIYRGEFFLGLIVGLTYTFGGVLPVIIVSLLCVIGLFSYKLVRPAAMWCVAQIRGK